MKACFEIEPITNPQLHLKVTILDSIGREKLIGHLSTLPIRASEYEANVFYINASKGIGSTGVYRAINGEIGINCGNLKGLYKAVFLLGLAHSFEGQKYINTALVSPPQLSVYLYPQSVFQTYPVGLKEICQNKNFDMTLYDLSFEIRCQNALDQEFKNEVLKAEAEVRERFDFFQVYMHKGFDGYSAPRLHRCINQIIGSYVVKSSSEPFFTSYRVSEALLRTAASSAAVSTASSSSNSTVEAVPSIQSSTAVSSVAVIARNNSNTSVCSKITYATGAIMVLMLSVIAAMQIRQVDNQRSY